MNLGFQADLKQNDEEGYAWAKEMFAKANAVLTDEGLPTYDEPDELVLPAQQACGSFPYSFLHYLRRAFAHLRERPDEPLAPVTDGNLDADKELVDDASSLFDSHLLCHSDCEGLYVPIDFPDPIFPDDPQAIPGGILGSSHGLLRELVEVAPHIGVRLASDGSLPPAEAERIASLSENEDHPFHVELLVWFALYEAAETSIRLRTAIVFS